MIIIKSAAEIAQIRQGGKILAEILARVGELVKPGATTAELEALAVKMMKQSGGRPSFKGYDNDGYTSPFPTALCVSINQEIVHGFALPAKIIAAGDVVSVDVGMEYPYRAAGPSGGYTDMAATFSAGKVSALARKLIKVTKQALDLGIAQVKPGNYIADISRAVQQYVEAQGFTVVRDLVGHGVGRQLHEDPPIPNFCYPGQPKIKLTPGMVIAIEPMVVTGKYHTKTLADDWTVVTVDGGLAAHFEHTVAVTERGHEILTLP